MTIEEPTRQHAVQQKVMGGLTEFAGNITFNEDLKKQGQDGIADGDKEYDAAQHKDEAKSTGNSVQGHVKSAVGSVVSDDLKKSGEEDKDKAERQHQQSKV